MTVGDMPTATSTTGLRALVAVAVAALDVSSGAEKLLSVAVEQIATVHGDRSTIWLTSMAADGAPTVASNHPDAIEAELEVACAAIDASAGPVVVSAEDTSGAW